MKKTNPLLLIFCLILVCSSALFAQTSWQDVKAKGSGELVIHYLEQKPTAYSSGGNLTGIEIDILRYFKDWLMDEKQINLSLKYVKHDQFSELYDVIKSGSGNMVGAATVSITDERRTEVKFSAPYLKNVSVLVSDGNLKTVKSKNDFNDIFSGLKPITIKGSIHATYLKEIIKATSSEETLTYVEEPMDVLLKIEESPKYYGYTDLLTFWLYLKNNTHFVKMHKVANHDNENFGFIFPKESSWDLIFSEFFERGFGFTATKDYRKILEKHLGYEVLERVELN